MWGVSTWNFDIHASGIRIPKDPKMKYTVIDDYILAQDIILQKIK